MCNFIIQSTKIKELEEQIRTLNLQLKIMEVKTEETKKSISKGNTVALKPTVLKQNLKPTLKHVKSLVPKIAAKQKYKINNQNISITQRKLKRKSKNNSFMRKETGNFSEDIIEFLNRNNVEYIDARRGSYTLYIIGGHELDTVVKESEKFGVKFTYVPGGWDATNKRSGWFAQFRVLDN